MFDRAGKAHILPRSVRARDDAVVIAQTWKPDVILRHLDLDDRDLSFEIAKLAPLFRSPLPIVAAWSRRARLDFTRSPDEGTRMSTVHLVGGEKGGVGKSVVARLLAQSFIDRGVRFAALDADQSHGALARSYAEFSQPVDLGRLESADQILDRALGADRRVLVDLPAQSHRALKRWIDATDVLAYAREMDVRVVLWHVTDGGFDSVAHLDRLLEDFGASIEYVVVKNEGRSKDFSQLEASATYQRLLALGGRVVTLPELDSAIMYKLDRFGSSFWAAVNASEGERALTTLERRRAKLWLERAEILLQQVEELGAFESRSVTVEQPALVHAEEPAFASDPSVN